MPDVNYIVLSIGRREFTYQVVFHEYTHLLVNQNISRLPLWLNEGFADFFSTFDGSEVDSRLIVGRPLDRYVGLLVGRAPPVPMSAFIDPASMRDLYRDDLTHGAVLRAELGARALPDARRQRDPPARPWRVHVGAAERRSGRSGVQAGLRPRPEHARRGAEQVPRVDAAARDPGERTGCPAHRRRDGDDRSGRRAAAGRLCRCGRARSKRRTSISTRRWRSIGST